MYWYYIWIYTPHWLSSTICDQEITLHAAALADLSWASTLFSFDELKRHLVCTLNQSWYLRHLIWLSFLPLHLIPCLFILSHIKFHVNYPHTRISVGYSHSAMIEWSWFTANSVSKWETVALISDTWMAPLDHDDGPATASVLQFPAGIPSSVSCGRWWWHVYCIFWSVLWCFNRQRPLPVPEEQLQKKECLRGNRAAESDCHSSAAAKFDFQSNFARSDSAVTPSEKL